MQECETGTETFFVKRVTVRSGGAGHAHSGVTVGDSPIKRSKPVDTKTTKVVTIGR